MFAPWGIDRQEYERDLKHNVSSILPFELYCSGCEPAKSVDMLEEYDVRLVVRLGDDDDFDMYVTHYDDSGWRVYEDILIEDSTNAEMSIDFLNRVTRQMRKAKGAVLVHCYAGISRSVSVCIAYLMRFKGMSYDKACGFMFDKRPCSSPNSKFRLDLARYYTYLLTETPRDPLEE